MATLQSYEVFFRVNNTESRRILQLHSNSESEAKEALCQQNSWYRTQNVIIYSITPR